MSEVFGSDLWCQDDLDPMMSEVDENDPLVVAQSIYRKFETPKGSVVDAPDWGRDVRALLEGGLTPVAVAKIPDILKAEVDTDDRVIESSVKVTTLAEQSIDLAIIGKTGKGPFALTGSLAADGKLALEIRTT